MCFSLAGRPCWQKSFTIVITLRHALWLIMISTNTLFDLAVSFVMHTNRHIFLTGRAGTGKTTFLKHIKEHSTKNTVIVAPTGVAAMNAGGMTINSLFQLPFGSFLPGRQAAFSQSPSEGTDLYTLLKNMRVNREKRKLLEEMELLIIDEVSMLRADTLDAIDGVLRHFRRKPEAPFGGVQVVFIGDLYQLPPVVNNDEWSYLSAYYKTMFFFDALVMQESRPLTIELNKVYRQSDLQFINLLNNIRNNVATDDDLQLLNKYYDPSFYPDAEDGYILLTSHNYKADKINQQALAQLQGETRMFEGTLTGEFNEKALPVDKTMALKEGAQIMFIRNDKGESRRYYNGKIGIISRIRGEEIFVKFPGSSDELQLEQETWRNIRYKYNEPADKIEEEELGAYQQYPIRLAWAVTIHKSQGLTFDKAIIDAGQSFAAGQVYVALSRLTSMQGLVLSSEITQAAIQTEKKIVDFANSQLALEDLERELENAQKHFLGEKLKSTFNWTKVAEEFRDHHARFNEIRIPSQEEAVEWSAGMLRQVTELMDVGERFIYQLDRMLPSGTEDGYATVNERVTAGADYFMNQINSRLLPDWQSHFDRFRLKNKVKKYTNTLKGLKTVLERKKQQIQQSVLLVHGLTEGRELSALLNTYQTTIKQQKVEVTGNSAKPKEESRMISLELLREGLTIDEIAKERVLARSTVEGHLISLIPTGEVELRQIVSKETEEAIRKALEHSSEKTAGAIRAALGDTFSYNEIRAVLNQVDREAAVS